MATRSIDNRKERLVTILVTPLMSCSARLPVYTILIGLVVPDTSYVGIFNMQGIALMGLYLLGFVAAVFSGWVANLFLKNQDTGYFIMEFPGFKIPKWSNVAITIVEKVKAFVLGAGKIIIAISIVLCVLSIFGPPGQMEKAEQEVEAISKERNLTEIEKENLMASRKLENSFAGYFGKMIEPAIRPLGFDWKIGIALLSSFAAREVFISTMNTIYSIGQSEQEESTIKQRMLAEKDPVTGKAFYTPALVVSLLLFYAFAMQCMSTLAIVQRETKSWKWPTVQFIYMTLLAYASSYVAFQLLS
jgi:ferrous iron transport protein B